MLHTIVCSWNKSEVLLKCVLRKQRFRFTCKQKNIEYKGQNSRVSDGDCNRIAVIEFSFPTTGNRQHPTTATGKPQESKITIFICSTLLKYEREELKGISKGKDKNTTPQDGDTYPYYTIMDIQIYVSTLVQQSN